MILCDFCELNKIGCDLFPDDDGCTYEGDDEAVIRYAQEHGISVSDAVALIKFCCNMI